MTIGQWLMTLSAIRNRILRYFYDIIAVSIAAQAGVLPWMLLFFGQTSNYFLLTNLILIPLAPVLVGMSFLLLVLSPFGMAGIVFGKVVNAFASVFCNAVFFVNNLPFATTHCVFTPWMSALLAAAIVLCYITLIFNSRKYSAGAASSAFAASAAAACLIAVVLLYYNNCKTANQRNELVINSYVVNYYGTRADTLSCDSCMTGFIWNGKKYMYVSSESLFRKKTSAPVHADYLVVGNIGRTSADELLGAVCCDTVVLTTRLGRYKAGRIKEKCESGNITIINTRNSEFVRNLTASSY